MRLLDLFKHDGETHRLMEHDKRLPILHQTKKYSTSSKILQEDILHILSQQKDGLLVWKQSKSLFSTPTKNNFLTPTPLLQRGVFLFLKKLPSLRGDGPPASAGGGEEIVNDIR